MEQYILERQNSIKGNIMKSFSNNIEKAKQHDAIIGKTRSGKDIYDTPKYKEHEKFSSVDHTDAAQLHSDLAHKSYLASRKTTDPNKRKVLQDNMKKHWASQNDHVTLGAGHEIEKSYDADFFSKGIEDLELRKIVQDIEKATYKEGDTKVFPNGITYVYTRTRPGSKTPYNWTRSEKQSGGGTVPSDKPVAQKVTIDFDNPSPEVKQLMDYASDKKSKADPKKKIVTNEQLLTYAKKKFGSIDENLRQVAQYELKKRGVSEDEWTKVEKKVDHNLVDDLKSEYADLMFDEPYQDPQERMRDYRIKIKSFITEHNAHLFVTGTGGGGKTQGLSNVMLAKGQREFDPQKDLPGDKDYDWVKKGRVTMSTLMRTLYEHNGKMIVFDDSDGILNNDDALNLLKLCMDDKPVRWAENDTNLKIMVRNPKYDMNDPDTTEEPEIPMPKRFRFTGKIAFISNRDRAYFMEDPDRKALMTRGDYIDLSFTNEEIMDLVSGWLDTMDLSNLTPVPAAQATKEKKEVYELIKEVVHRIPQGNISGRTIESLVKKKRAIEAENEEIEAENKTRKGSGQKPEPLIDWKRDAVKQLMMKGEEDGDIGSMLDLDIEKAMDVLQIGTPIKKERINVNQSDTELEKACEILEL